MATGVTTQHPFNDQPYITIAEYKNAPTSLDINNLVIGGNANAQDAELANVILRASSYMDEYLNQNLNAALQVENQRTRFTPQGYIALHPNNNPVISLSSFQYGTDPNNLITLPDCSVCWFEEQQIIIPVAALSTTWTNQGPLGFGGGGGSRAQIFTRYQYVAGYVNNFIASATAAASTMTVQSAIGIVAGMQLRIYDGASSETVTVSSSYTYGSTTVPLAAPLSYSHASGVPFGNMPNAIKQACILMTSAFIKARGDSSMTMQMTVNPSRSYGDTSTSGIVGNDVALALSMINLYRRVR